MMVEDTNLILEKPLTFSDARRMSWLALSASLRVVVAFWAGWLTGGLIVSSTATVRGNVKDDTASVSKLVMTYSNVTITWEKNPVT
jgi:hypothetical protein